MSDRPAAPVAAAAVLALTGCIRQDGRTVGQQVDSMMAKVEQKADQAVEGVKSVDNQLVVAK